MFTDPSAPTNPVVQPPKINPGGPIVRGGQNIPGFAAGDPGYQAALAAYQQRLADAGSQLKSTREQELINFGDPNLAQAGGLGDIDPAVLAAIKANTDAGNSITAQLAHAHQQAVTSILNNLAARGLLSSGDLGARQSQEAQAYGHNLYGAQQQALGVLQNALSSYLQQKSGFQGDLNGALENAYQNYVSHPALYTGAAGAAPSPPAAPRQFAAPSLPKPQAPHAPVVNQVAARIGGLSANPAQGVFAIR